MSEEKQSFVNDTNIADENLPDQRDLCTLYDTIFNHRYNRKVARAAVWCLIVALLVIGIGKDWFDWVTIAVLLIVFVVAACLATCFSLLVNWKREENFHHYADLLAKANRQLKAEGKDEVLSGHDRKTVLRIIEVLQIKEIDGDLVLPVDIPDPDEEEDEEEGDAS